MEPSHLELTLIPKDDEAASWDVQDEYERVEKELQSKAVWVLSRAPIIPQGYVGGSPDLLAGVFILKLLPTVGPILSAAMGAWLHARYGRKVRIKVGDIEVEAQTPEELESLLDKAQEIQERSEPKRIIP